MILELDIGNSRIKWRRCEEKGGAILDQGQVCDVAELFSSAAAELKPLMVRLGSVRDVSITRRITHWTKELWDLQPRVATVSRSCGGVTIHYTDVSNLGVDRWLAMLAGYRRAGGACVIIDGGTALTVDVVAADGHHLGGYIVPGLKLMATSLQQNTGIRLSENAIADSLELGNSTDEAVANGTLASLVALIKQVLTDVANPDTPAKHYFSGGDAQLLVKMLAIENAEIASGLVMDGLAIACPFDRA